MIAWFDMEEKEYNGLLRLQAVYYHEAVRCIDARAYIAGCTVAGAALEAMLLAMLHLYGREVEDAGYVPMSKGKPKKILDWRLSDMLHAAAGMGWLPRGLKLGADWNFRRAQIGDYADALRQMRNLVHPARYLQDHSPLRVTKKYLARYIEVLEGASQHLEAKIHESLRKEIDAEGSNPPTLEGGV